MLDGVMPELKNVATCLRQITVSSVWNSAFSSSTRTGNVNECEQVSLLTVNVTEYVPVAA